MKILDIITEMESSNTCVWSILGDGGVVVVHPNHPNYPTDLFGQKSNNRYVYQYQIDDRDITKTMVFMRNLDINTEMESSQTCMWSILGDGGVAVVHSNHPNYAAELFGQKSNNRYQYQIDDRDITKTMVFMRNLDIITEMESSQTCMWSILGDGGVAVVHSNHPNYPAEMFDNSSLQRRY